MKSRNCRPGPSSTVDAGVALERRHRGRRDVDRGLDLTAAQVRDHRVVVGEVLQAEPVDLRLRAVELRVRREDRDGVLLVLREHERTAAHERLPVLGEVRELPQPLAVAGRVLLPDVLRKDRDPLELLEDVRGGQGVRHDQRVVVRRLDRLHVREPADEAARGAVAVLEDRVEREVGVLRGERLAVGPLRVRRRVERPHQPVGGRLPLRGEVGQELVARGIELDQLRVDVLERGVGVLLEGHERVHRVDVRRRADDEVVVARRTTALVVAAADSDHRDRRDRHHELRRRAHPSLPCHRTMVGPRWRERIPDGLRADRQASAVG